jgi:hypothetical protein
MSAAAKLLIGAGTGCCARAEHEPRVDRPAKLTRKQWVDSFRTWGVLKAALARDEAAKARDAASRAEHETELELG